MDETKKVITRKKTKALPPAPPSERPIADLTDAERFKALKEYGTGKSVTDIAKELGVSNRALWELLDNIIAPVNAVRETNSLLYKNRKSSTPTTTPTAVRLLGQEFLDLLTGGAAEVYAYYFVSTGDNEFALEQAGLAKGIPKNCPRSTFNHIYKLRGQFLQDLPEIKAYIRQEQDRKLAQYNIDKSYVQTELVHQIESLKQLATNDGRQRSNLLKAVELLGRTIGAFTDRVEVEEVDAKSGLSILMEKAKREVSEAREITTGSYTVEDC